MLSRNIYRIKKSPLAGRRQKTVIFGAVAVSLFLIAYFVYSISSIKKVDSSKSPAVVSTGDQPVAQNLVVYVSADGGLSLRSDHDSASKRLALIPNNTKLTVSQELDGWYKINYESKDGWVAKKYTTTTAPPEDPTKDWQTFSSPAGYKIKYQPEWKVQDYGAQTAVAASSLVAFSNQELPATIPAGSDFIAPITLSVSTKSAADASKNYSQISGVVSENITVAGRPASKYTYTSPSTNTQLTSVVLDTGSQVFVFSEGGGYADDLLKMLNTLTIG